VGVWFRAGNCKDGHGVARFFSHIGNPTNGFRSHFRRPPVLSARSGPSTSDADDRETQSVKHTMSLQVNLSSRELLTAYQNVVNANGIDWVLFTYDKGSNDLKVQSTGDGGLEELEEEFSDGR
jgi:hypothetical protein